MRLIASPHKVPSVQVIVLALIVLAALMILHPGDHTEGISAIFGLISTLIARVTTTDGRTCLPAERPNPSDPISDGTRVEPQAPLS